MNLEVRKIFSHIHTYQRPILALVYHGYTFTKHNRKKEQAKHIYIEKNIVDYADDIALLANTPAQFKTLLHSFEWAAGGIGLKTYYLCFCQRVDLSTLDGGHLELVDKLKLAR